MAAPTDPGLVRFTPAELIEAVRSGRVRYPNPAHRSAAKVAEILDALHRRYPQRPPLLWRDPGGTADRFWLLDGGDLISALLRAFGAGADQRGSEEPIWFDTDLGEVVAWRHRPDRRHVLLPVPSVLTTPDLDEYLGAEDVYGERAERARAFVAAMREHPVLAQVTELPWAELPRLLRNLALRSGVSLSDIRPSPDPQDDPPASFFRRRSGPRSLVMAAWGDFGTRVPDTVLWRALLVADGRDPDLFYDESASATDLPDDGRAAVHAVVQAQSFLCGAVGYPAGRLLPETGTLPVVARFLRVFPDPGEPVWRLLRRWVWRTALAGADPDDRPEALAMIAGDDPIRSAVQLLATAQIPELVPPGRVPLDPDDRYGRLVLLGLASLHPRDLASGLLVDVEEVAAPRKIIPVAGFEAANLVLQDRWWQGAFQNTRHAVETARRDLLTSHGIDDVAVDFLRAGADEEFLARRTEVLDRTVVDFWTAVVEPAARTRRPIASLFEDRYDG